MSNSAPKHEPDRQHEHGPIQWIPVGDLKPSAKNARTHSKAQVKKLKTSIRKFGFTSPVLCAEDNQILAGHGRVAAAKELGLTHVPCRRLINLSEADKQAYLLADNRLSMDAGWDLDLLAKNFEQLANLDFDMVLTGFELPEIDKVLSQHKAESTRRARAGEDDVPPLDPACVVSRLGDIWNMGGHRLVCGDARQLTVISELMGSDCADMIFADPPYNVEVNGHVSGLGKVQHAEFPMASGEMSREEFSGFLSITLANGRWFCRDGAIAFVCMDWRHIAELVEVGRKVFTEFKNLCVWNKTNAGMGTFYRSKHELVAVFKVGKAPHTNTFGLGDKGRYRTNVWNYAGVNSFAPDRMEQLERHPTSKPVDLVADAIRDVSNRGDVVLDMFGGSGTTLIAAQSTGRIARLVELDPAYCDVIVRRWQNHTGKSAILDSTKDTFEDVEACRQTRERGNG